MDNEENVLSVQKVTNLICLVCSFDDCSVCRWSKKSHFSKKIPDALFYFPSNIMTFGSTTKKQKVLYSITFVVSVFIVFV